MKITQLNEFAIDVNGKLIIKSIDREVWLCDEFLTHNEHEAFQNYIQEYKQKLTNKIKSK